MIRAVGAAAGLFAAGVGVIGTVAAAGEPARLLRRVPPRFPALAVDRGIDGCVVASFDIGLHGRPENLAVVEAVPPGVFEQVTLEALRFWQFQVPVPSCAGRYYQTLDYRMSPAGEPGSTRCAEPPADACPIDTSTARIAKQ